MTIWHDCNGEKHIQPISGTLYRLVESQEQVATLGYVDTLDEQAVLEELIESVKPTYLEGTEKLHYLLKTPFRYPPLKWGSRFGQTHETSIFYGGASPDVTLAECAYYRFLFWYSMDHADMPKDSIQSEHTLFSIGYATYQGIKLQEAPFSTHQEQLTHPSDYRPSQQLGTDMRNAQVVGFEYLSARDKQQGVCIGLFSPAFRTKKPKDRSQWLCQINANRVSFKKRNESHVYHFPLSDFLINGKLPTPA